MSLSFFFFMVMFMDVYLVFKLFFSNFFSVDVGFCIIFLVVIWLIMVCFSCWMGVVCMMGGGMFCCFLSGNDKFMFVKFLFEFIIFGMVVWD